MEPRITSVEPMQDFHLKIIYENGETKLFDVKPYIQGTYYSELAKENYFKQVRVISDGWTVGWPNEQDMAPDDMYELSVPCQLQLQTIS
jgi:hypothetical protein